MWNTCYLDAALAELRGRSARCIDLAVVGPGLYIGTVRIFFSRVRHRVPLSVLVFFAFGLVWTAAIIVFELAGLTAYPAAWERIAAFVAAPLMALAGLYLAVGFYRGFELGADDE